MIAACNGRSLHPSAASPCLDQQVTRPKSQRVKARGRLALLLPDADLQAITCDIGITDVIASANRLLAGQVRGRVVVNVNT